MPDPNHALPSELANPAYAGLSDQQAAVAVNAKTVPSPAPLWQIQQYVMQQANYITLRRASLTPGDPDFPVAAAAADMIFHGKFEAVDLSLPAVQATIAGIVAAGWWTSADAAAIEALGTIPWWKSVGLPRPVRAIDVTLAR